MVQSHITYIFKDTIHSIRVSKHTLQCHGAQSSHKDGTISGQVSSRGAVGRLYQRKASSQRLSRVLRRLLIESQLTDEPVADAEADAAADAVVAVEEAVELAAATAASQAEVLLLAVIAAETESCVPFRGDVESPQESAVSSRLGPYHCQMSSLSGPEHCRQFS